MADGQADDFPSLFLRLRSVLQPHAAQLVVKADEPGNYYLECPPSGKYPKGLFFGAVQVKKRYVSFHLMPAYMFPDLLKGMSDRLKKRMQGKSCFNFTRPDEEMIDELTKLTHQGFERLKREGLL